jgi:hypothetical protein
MYASGQLGREPVRAESAPKRSQVFYRYEGADGRVLIVDSKGKLPADARESAQRIELSGGAGETPAGDGSYNLVAPLATDERAPADVSTAVDPSPFTALPNGFDNASFGAGLGVGLLLAAVLLGVFGRSSSGGFFRRIALRGALVVGLAALVGSAYFGWMRRTTGQGEGTLATPGQLIDDAKRAVEEVQQRRRDQERQLEEIDQLAK